MWIESPTAVLGARVHDAGDAQAAVVVVHDLGDSIDGWSRARPGWDPLRLLAAHQLAVLALDLPGHGRSGGARGHIPYRRAVTAVVRAVSAARQLWDLPVVVLGVGVGGSLALASADPSVVARSSGGAVADAAVACGPHDLTRPPARIARLHPLLRWLPAFAGVPRQLVVPFGRESADPRVALALARHPQAVRAFTAGGLLDLYGGEHAAAVPGGPALVLAGDNGYVPASDSRDVAGSAGAELTIVPGGSANLLLDHAPVVVTELLWWLRRVGLQRAR